MLPTRAMPSMRVAHGLRARHLCDKGDSYYGPGGLSARQIFDKVNESREKEAAGARQKQRATTQSPPSATLTEKDLQTKSSKELRELLVARHVSVADCFEKADLVARARAHLL